MPNQLKVRLSKQVMDVRLLACEKIVHADHFVASCDKAIAKMRAEKSCPSSNEYALHVVDGIGRSTSLVRTRLQHIQFSLLLICQRGLYAHQLLVTMCTMTSRPPLNPSDSRIVVGVMTGTSMDGIDAALVRMVGEGSAKRAELLRYTSEPLGELSDRLRRAATQVAMTAGEFAALAWDFGLLHTEAISRLLGSQSAADLIAVHGQTIFHQPPHSWQLINPAPIAARFKCPVAYDLRQADLALGGQGAPITPAADWILFRKPGTSRAIVNLGGFCNVTILPANQSDAESDVRGFDVCACNQVLDAVARQALSQSFDLDGQSAMSGQVKSDAVQALLDVLHRQSSAGRSLGTGDEAGMWVEQYKGEMRGEDIAATAVAAVGQCIAAAIQKYDVDEILVAGGGARNAALMAQIGKAASKPVWMTEVAGVPVEAREAMCIAVLGDQAFVNRSACAVAWPTAE